MGSDYTIIKVGTMGYYTICCVLLVAFTKLLYANELKQRWAKLVLYSNKTHPIMIPLICLFLFFFKFGQRKTLLKFHENIKSLGEKNTKTQKNDVQIKPNKEKLLFGIHIYIHIYIHIFILFRLGRFAQQKYSAETTNTLTSK